MAGNASAHIRRVLNRQRRRLLDGHRISQPSSKTPTVFSKPGGYLRAFVLRQRWRKAESLCGQRILAPVRPMLGGAIKTARDRPLNVPNMKSRQPFIALCVALPPQLLCDAARTR
jgi:hypothetical protein